MTTAPPLEQFGLIERMVDHVVQQLEHVLARDSPSSRWPRRGTPR